MSATSESSRVLEPTIGGPDPVRFPSGWTYSGSWHRAQAAPSTISPTENQAQYIIRLGYIEPGRAASFHRVTFAIHGGQLVAECGCPAWDHRRWCAHVAACWWAWVRGELEVLDHASGRTYRQPPAWLRVEDAEAGHP